MGNISREDLFREIGEIDEAYVEEAERARRRRRTVPWIRTLAAAASLLVCVGAGYGVLRLTWGGASGSANDMSGMTGGGMENMMVPYSTAQETDDGKGVQMPEANPEFETEGDWQEADIGGGIDAQMLEANPVSERSGDLLEAGTEEGEKQTQNCQEAEQERASLETDTGEGEKQTQNCQGAEQARAPLETADGKIAQERKDILTETAGTMATESGQASASERLTWEAARGDAVYGKYVDVQVPEGYAYESGVRSASSLHLIWTNGGEEISIGCRHADESVSDWLVDAANPQEYDLGLYPIPWCDSVPQELIQKVSNATFYPSQITPEIVAARSYQADETGDVSGWRTDIGILYSDNVLVVIRGKGPSPEEIYAMINLEN